MSKQRIRVKRFQIRPDNWTPEMDYLMGMEVEADIKGDRTAMVDDEDTHMKWDLMPDEYVMLADQCSNVEPSPDEKQIGGSHYTDMTIEPWEVIERAGLDYWDGNAIKYIMRHGSKNGVEDLKKAIHYIEKKISLLEKENTK